MARICSIVNGYRQRRTSNSQTAPSITIGLAYRTDHLGRVVEVVGKIDTVRGSSEIEERRHKTGQSKAGKSWDPYRIYLDDGGHLIAAQLGGAGEAINMVPMGRELNRHGSWRQMEREWSKRIKGGADIEVSITIRYPEGDSVRPSEFSVEWRDSSEEKTHREPLFTNRQVKK